MSLQKRVLVGAAVTVGVAGAIVSAPILVGAAGFGSAGVAAGSMAAAWQSTMGGYVVAGSTFAWLQSVGATGALALSGTTTAAAAGAAGATVSGFMAAASRFFNAENDADGGTDERGDESESDEGDEPSGNAHGNA